MGVALKDGDSVKTVFFGGKRHYIGVELKEGAVYKREWAAVLSQIRNDGGFSQEWFFETVLWVGCPRRLGTERVRF